MLPDAHMTGSPNERERQEHAPVSIVTVTFEETESVTQGGTEVITYQVHHQRVWLPPHRVPGAIVEMRPTGPARLWCKLTRVALPLGTKVERLTRRPVRARATAAQVLLGKSSGLSHQTRRIALSVGPKGRLVPA
jgi:hypothetical protein